MIYVDIDNTFILTQLGVYLYAPSLLPYIDVNEKPKYFDHPNKKLTDLYIRVLNEYAWKLPNINLIQYLITKDEAFTILTSRKESEKLRPKIDQILGSFRDLCIQIIWHKNAQEKVYIVKENEGIIIDDDPEVANNIPDRIVLALTPYNEHLKNNVKETIKSYRRIL